MWAYYTPNLSFIVKICMLLGNQLLLNYIFYYFSESLKQNVFPCITKLVVWEILASSASPDTLVILRN